MTKNARGALALFLCSFFWGMAFSAQSNAMRHIGPYTFVFLRSSMTCAVLFLCLPLLHRLAGALPRPALSKARYILIGGLCGTVLVAATILQQVGLVTTTPAKSGFVTALYIIIVPMLSALLGVRPRPVVWAAALLSVAGLYLLCMDGSMTLAVGDLFTLACAFVFAIHIIVVDRFGRALDAVLLSALQFAFAALWSSFLAFGFETPSMAGILACWKDLLFVAVFSGALGYTLQIVGQKNTGPSLAAVIMCLESVFAALGGWILLGDSLTPKEILGCALMLSATIVAQAPTSARRTKR